MSNRRKLRPGGQGVGAGSRVVAGASWFNKMARKSCSECGAPVRWVDAAEAREHGMNVDEAVAFLEVDSVTDVECWVCTSCDNAGVMGPASMG